MYVLITYIDNFGLQLVSITGTRFYFLNYLRNCVSKMSKSSIP